MQQQAPNWKERALEASVVITDAWEITKTYAGRIAEWVLFVCMIINIVEILPGVQLWPWVSNTVLGVQAITMDIAGFGLASMADQARASGDEKAAAKAQWTGYFLIGIMIITLLSVSAGLLYPPLKPYTDNTEKVLILVRVVMTVVYGHVIHTLRRVTEATTPHPTASQVPDPTQVIDYQEIARHLLPMLPAPQVLDYSSSPERWRHF